MGTLYLSLNFAVTPTTAVKMKYIFFFNNQRGCWLLVIKWEYDKRPEDLDG